ncbi:TRAP transporter small permease [Qingshengfaniella alkalisoli]|uniref:TRAP transporter small permease protein n=1 Tax=Qingshengfaniella alkalisoli TaxID=2599296 RepID=A0A5B8J852_9RHOB|nr:TRAP transporter small permease [Qingshengfaniella alkalisoli]QDY70440.1 TRAP transporter small permease [Qingshengfaniella alkalisoli]
MKPPGKYSAEGIAASLLFVALIFIVMLQILGRTALFTGPVWTEEAARWLWVWMAMIGISEVERTDSQLRMGFLVEALRRRIRVAIFTIIDVIYLGIVVHLIWIGWKTVQRTWSNESVTLPVSDAVLYASGFIAMILVANRVIRRITGLGHRRDPEELEVTL